MYLMYEPYTTHYPSIRSGEELVLETSTLHGLNNLFCGGK